MNSTFIDRTRLTLVLCIQRKTYHLFPSLMGGLVVLLFSTFPSHALLAKETALDNAPASYTVGTSDDGEMTILRDGKMVTKLVARSGSKPILWPLVGPDGMHLSRAYPMTAAKPGEAEDHIHHRSLWFTHGEVNGIDFWAEGEGRGIIQQTEAIVREIGERVVIETTSDWLSSEGKRILSDKRKLTFHDDEGCAAIDFDIQLIASDGPVNFGDTKEGSFGIRVAGPIKVDAKQGGKITNSRGEEDGKTWGKPAEWVDYTGPIDGKTYGIAILNHPSSFAFPTRWHVRTYGLFAANPFGVHHFVGGEPTEGVTLAAGNTMSIRYRVLLHAGTTTDADIASAWKRYEVTP